jgi:transposase InsO family protein
VLEHGFYERQASRRAFVPHSDGGRSVHPGVCLLEADGAMTGMKVAQAVQRAKAERGSLPASITVDNGSEFCSRNLEAWVMGNGVQLCFIRPDRPVENGPVRITWFHAGFAPHRSAKALCGRSRDVEPRLAYKRLEEPF